MIIAITGGTGFIGTHLTNMLGQRGHDLIILTRDPKKYAGRIHPKRSYLSVDSEMDQAIEGCDAIINLAGENLVARRWTRSVKEELINSRAGLTARLVNAIKKAGKKPSVLISASAAGYYGSRGDDVLTEEEPPGSDFGAQICVRWEAEANKAKEWGVRVVSPRFGIPLETDGGAFAKMLTPFKLFVGGPIGRGTQYFPWIHMRDLCNSVIHALEDNNMQGPYNVASPNQVTMDEFASALGQILKRPSVFRVPEFGLRLAFGEGGMAMTASTRLEPAAITAQGFKFEYPKLDDALRSLLDKR